MEKRRRTDEYAGNQVRLLLGDLKNSNHSHKIKAIKRFKTYIEEYYPDVADDTVDFLYTGMPDGLAALPKAHDGQGLLHYCGQASENHR